MRASANLRLATEADGVKGDGHVFRNLPEATDGQLQGPTGMRVDLGRSCIKQGSLTMTLGSDPLGYLYTGGRVPLSSGLALDLSCRQG